MGTHPIFESDFDCLTEMSSIYRSGIWFAKGYMEYTKSGYEKAAKNFTELKSDLFGKHVLITGANSGIGLAAACQLAKMGANIHIACRNQERGNTAIDEISKVATGETPRLHILDLSKSSSVHLFANQFKNEISQLYCLVNNAGCMVNTRTVNDDGLEMNFATNTLGMYILTNGLLDSITDRVITVTSGGMLTQKLQLDDLQFEKGTFDGTRAYAQQKRQQVAITEEWSKMHSNIHFSTTHPGWSDTPAVRSAMPEFYEKMKDNLRTAEQGGDCITWLVACDKDALGSSGGFYQDRQEVAKHLPLAWSKESQSERTKLLSILDEMYEKSKPKN